MQFHFKSLQTIRANGKTKFIVFNHCLADRFFYSVYFFCTDNPTGKTDFNLLFFPAVGLEYPNDIFIGFLGFFQSLHQYIRIIYFQERKFFP